MASTDQQASDAQKKGSSGSRVPIIVAVIGMISAIVVSLISSGAQFDRKFEEITDRVDELGSQLDAAENDVELLREELVSVRESGALSSDAAFDTDWIDIGKECNTVTFDLPGPGLPRIVTAYYRNLDTDGTYIFGINQYGDGHQSNGVLLDFDEDNRKLYIRLPCGMSGGNASIHLGSYKDRSNTANESIVSVQRVQFRVIGWT